MADIPIFPVVASEEFGACTQRESNFVVDCHASKRRKGYAT